MKHWKTISAVLASALAVTACGAGNGTGTGAGAGSGTGSGTGGVYAERGVGSRGAEDGAGSSLDRFLPRAGRERDGRFTDPDRAPFPRNLIRPLDEWQPGAGAMRPYALEQPVTVPYLKDGGERYVSLDALVELMEFDHYEVLKDGTVEIGDTDVVYRLKEGSDEAEKEGEPHTLAAPLARIEGKLALTAAAAAELFTDDLVFDVRQEGLVVYPSDNGIPATLHDTDEADGASVDPSLDFADDPDDPFKGDENAEGVFEPFADDPGAVPALKNIDMNALIRTAKKYIGVKYDFGADPYPQSNRFDCSSYTQYVYGKFGINLPRSARAQARVGKTVSRKKLRKGDLLFFYVPGRFKSNKTVGHVGIYIGNRMMIHANTEPKNGVQIRSIDREFWKKTFLKAKRVAY